MIEAPDPVCDAAPFERVPAAWAARVGELEALRGLLAREAPGNKAAKSVERALLAKARFAYPFFFPLPASARG